MSNASIQFDCLIPEAAAELMPQRFEQLADKLIRDGLITSAAVRHSIPDDAPERDLRDIYLQTHDTLSDDRVHRFTIEVGAPRSINHVAMLFSRLLTPPVPLPKDPAALENEAQFEQPAPYPWFLSVRENA